MNKHCKPTVQWNQNDPFIISEANNKDIMLLFYLRKQCLQTEIEHSHFKWTKLSILQVINATKLKCSCYNQETCKHESMQRNNWDVPVINSNSHCKCISLQRGVTEIEQCFHISVTVYRANAWACNNARMLNCLLLSTKLSTLQACNCVTTKQPQGQCKHVVFRSMIS